MEKSLAFVDVKEREAGDKTVFSFVSEDNKYYSVWEPEIAEAIKSATQEGESVVVDYSQKKNGKWLNNTITAVKVGDEWIGKKSSSGDEVSHKQPVKSDNKPDNKPDNKASSLIAATSLVSAVISRDPELGSPEHYAGLLISVTKKINSEVFGG